MQKLPEDFEREKDDFARLLAMRDYYPLLHRIGYLRMCAADLSVSQACRLAYPDWNAEHFQTLLDMFAEAIIHVLAEFDLFVAIKRKEERRRPDGPEVIYVHPDAPESIIGYAARSDAH